MDARVTAGHPIIEEAHRVEGSARYTAQANFFRATVYGGLNMALGIATAVLGIIAAASIVSDWSTTLAAILALVAAVLGIVQTVINPDGRANEHKQQGNAYRALQADARVFRTVDYDTMSDDVRRTGLDELMQERTRLNARNRPGWLAFKVAQRKINRTPDLEDDD